MTKKPTPLILGSTAALLVALGGAVWALCQEPPVAMHALPDGSRVGLVGTTYGSSQRLILGPLWKRMLCRVLPTEWADRLGAPTTAPSAMPNSFAAYLLRTGSANAPGQEVEVVAVDGRGMVYHASVNGGIELPGGRGTVRTFGFPAFPRRAGSFRVRAYAPAFRAPLAEWRVMNPDPGPHAIWTAPQLPTSTRDGELEVRLLKLVSGIARPDPPRPARPGAAVWSRAELEVLKGGRPIEWEAGRVTLSDASGNTWSPDSTAQGKVDGRCWLAFGGGLSPEEAAYKLRFTLRQVRGFGPAELCTIRGVPVPGRNVVVPVGRGRDLGGGRLTVIDAGGPGAMYRSGGYTLSIGTPGVRVRFDRRGASPGWIRLLSATDGRGRGVKLMDEPLTRNGDDIYFPLRLPSARGPVALTFAVATDRTVELTAKPAWVGP
jgi:hypothetical protein